MEVKGANAICYPKVESEKGPYKNESHVQSGLHVSVGQSLLSTARGEVSAHEVY